MPQKNDFSETNGEIGSMEKNLHSYDRAEKVLANDITDGDARDVPREDKDSDAKQEKREKQRDDKAANNEAMQPDPTDTETSQTLMTDKGI